MAREPSKPVDAAAYRRDSAAKADRFPAELKPNPGYVYELPREVVINGKRCVEVDAGILPWAAGMNRGSRGA